MANKMMMKVVFFMVGKNLCKGRENIESIVTFDGLYRYMLAIMKREGKTALSHSFEFQIRTEM